jgi:hypothetical protein
MVVKSVMTNKYTVQTTQPSCRLHRQPLTRHNCAARRDWESKVEFNQTKCSTQNVRTGEKTEAIEAKMSAFAINFDLVSQPVIFANRSLVPFDAEMTFNGKAGRFSVSDPLAGTQAIGVHRQRLRYIPADTTFVTSEPHRPIPHPRDADQLP